METEEAAPSPPTQAVEAKDPAAVAAAEQVPYSGGGPVWVEDAIAEYTKRMQANLAKSKSKPDMIACRELRQIPKYAWTPAYGHVPGVEIGRVFKGRGEMCAVGMHGHILPGIYSAKEFTEGALCICLAGMYKDDQDLGTSFIYTGVGGQLKNKGGTQVKDQKWKTGNLALRRNLETGTAVRVCRGKVGPNKERLYVYEGLYNVVNAEMVPSVDGPLVCKFKLVGVPGESVASTQVGFKELAKTKNPYSEFHVKRIKLAGRSSSSKRRKTAKLTRDAVLQMFQGRPGLLCEDLSNGLETLPVALFNETDDGVGPPDFQYVTDYCGADDVEELAAAASKPFDNKFKGACGLTHMGDVPYNDDSLLCTTLPAGVHECNPQVCKSRMCQRNMVVTGGVSLPLEVFRAPMKGWGVRSAQDVVSGQFICAYVGQLLGHVDANKLAGTDDYLFDLDHFHLLLEEVSRDDAEEIAKTDEGMAHLLQAAPRLPPLLENRDVHLVVDARVRGNVARFINHSCDPNCVVQTVFAREARSGLMYYMGIFAQKPIPAGEELTYNYGYLKGMKGEGKGIDCHCGAEGCEGVLV